ncbi:MAG: type II toxin-antitoxin system RelE/ParE family toxin [Methylacidiphilales bacterium]|nr:type II toxin-antitoxin system RelE/ParE family toxin [Candidatus Methylacidiphilales bacterium]
MKRLLIHPAAAREAAKAAKYYQLREISLGRSFLMEASVAMEKARCQPLLYTCLQEDFRRVQLARFPYGVIFRMSDEDTIHIIAVMHLHREPGYWRDRAD